MEILRYARDDGVDHYNRKFIMFKFYPWKTLSGFTLIELMVVLAIIGILITIALPAYQTYLYKAHVAEALSMMESVKLDVTEYHITKGMFPAEGLMTAAAKGGLSYPAAPVGKYGQVELAANGQVFYTFNQTSAPAPLHGAVVSVQPGVDALGTLIWQCGSTPVAEQLCNGSICAVPPVASLTQIDPRFLLASCA
jgi:type IV pilus assembly protein PilA